MRENQKELSEESDEAEKQKNNIFAISSAKNLHEHCWEKKWKSDVRKFVVLPASIGHIAWNCSTCDGHQLNKLPLV